MLLKAVTANKWSMYINWHLNTRFIYLHSAWKCSWKIGSVDVTEGVPLLPWALPGCAVATGRLCHCPAALERQQQAPVLGFALGLQIFYCKEAFCVLFCFFSLTYPSKPRSVGSEKQASRSVMHEAARRTPQGSWGGREGISCLPLITVRKWTHSGDLIYFQSYWQSLNWNDGMKSNRQWVMKGQ